MKTALYTALLLVAGTSGWGQGTVQFQNGQITFATAADRLIYGGYSGSRLTGTNWAAGLYYLPGSDQNIMSPDSGTQAGALAFFRPPTTVTPGVWNNGAAGNTRTLDGVAIRSIATLQVRVWDITRFATFAQAFAAGQYGWSQPFNFRAPDFADGEPATAAYMEGLRAFIVCADQCPEPTTLALGFIAGGAWLCLRLRRPKHP
jgi:hypothetical protein